ncbi:sensor domain-containing protein [Streptomyces polygonati]|uniref:Sensor domain-containing protein n=1 Tax=Streptomyces polygonati TaxID=1617087 RepID=A0ABV8HSB3_9ACTN
MRKTRCAAATAAVLPVLLLAAACSGNSSDADGNAKTGTAKPSASTTPPGKVPLTKAQLTSALITTADVPGWTVQVSQTTATDSQDDSTLTADKPQCQPLADITSSKPKIPRMAFVGAAFAKTTGQTNPDQIDQMLVASQAPGDAQKVIDSVKAALGTCTSFSAVDNTGTKTPFAITKGPAVATGDASASYVMTDTADKKTGAALVTVVKTGDTITAYLSVKAAGGPGQLPLDVARKQSDKLKAAQAK